MASTWNTCRITTTIKMATSLASGDDYNKLLFELEKQELEAPGGIATSQVYEQMLALLLLRNDLCNAKYLWKRIPQSMKAANEQGAELALIWAVGQQMWQRNFPGIYEALNQTWSDNVSLIMAALTETTRKQAIQLVSQAYSSIGYDDFSQFLGLPIDKAIIMATQQGWLVDNSSKMVIPKKSSPVSSPAKPSEEHLLKLTEFVSFLEN